MAHFSFMRNSLHAQQAKAHKKQRPAPKSRTLPILLIFYALLSANRSNYFAAIAACAAARRAIGTRNGEQDT